ncbi:MAG: hypothetical protein JSR58_05855 [Verrucomicrobia bacterium]|nr:hypothetical protein [Verrucomicrobiota bacterium]
MKFILKLIILLAVCILLLIAFAPSILSTAWGKHMASKMISRFYHVDLEADVIDLSWMKGQNIQNLHVRDAKNNELLSCASLTTDASLWQILTKRDVGHLVIQQPKATIFASSASPRAISLAPASLVPQVSLVPAVDMDFTGNVQLHQGMFDFKSAQLPTVSLTDVEVALNRDASGKIEGTASASSDQGTLQVQGSLIPRTQIDVTAKLHQFPLQILSQFAPAELLQDKIDINLDLHVKSDQFLVNLDASSPQFSAKMATQSDTNTVTLAAPASIYLKLPPSLVGSTAPVELNITIPEFSLPLDKQEAFSFRALIDCTGISLEQTKIEPWFADISTKDFSGGEFTVLAKSQQLLQPLNLSVKMANLNQGTISTPLLALPSATLDNLTLSYQKADRYVDVDLQTGYSGATVQLTSRIQPQDKSAEFSGTLSQWTAPILDMPLSLAFQGKASPASQQISVQGSSDVLKFSAMLENKNDILQLLKPATLNWTLTPETYEKLDIRLNQKPGPFALTQNTQIDLQISALSLPLKNADFAHIQIAGVMTAPEISFTEKASGTVTTIQNLKWQISQAKPGAPLDFKLSTNVHPKGSLQAEGTFDPDKQNTQVSMKVQKFPTPALDLIARSFGKARLPLTTALGPTIDATLVANIQNGSGPLTLNLTSETAKASVQGLVTNGVLTLQDTLHAQLQMTPELSRELFDLAIESAEAPITVEVPSDGFSLPLFPMSLDQIQIPSARIELGKIACRNEGNLSLTLGILKFGPSKNEALHLWFAPIDLHVKNGVIDWERTEILLADTFDVCLWGTVDLPKNDVQMILGLTADALRRAFGIKDLPQKYVLHVPITGTLDNVKINSGAATAKVAALMIWQKKAVAGGALGGPAGALLGELVNKLGPLPDGDAKTPAAKKPFPWDKTTSESEDPPPVQKKKKHFRTEDKPLKQIIKMIR